MPEASVEPETMSECNASSRWFDPNDNAPGPETVMGTGQGLRLSRPQDSRQASYIQTFVICLHAPKVSLAFTFATCYLTAPLSASFPSLLMARGIVPFQEPAVMQSPGLEKRWGREPNLGHTAQEAYVRK